jgi:hypothetical protein
LGKSLPGKTMPPRSFERPGRGCLRSAPSPGSGLRRRRTWWESSSLDQDQPKVGLGPIESAKLMTIAEIDHLRSLKLTSMALGGGADIATGAHSVGGRRHLPFAILTAADEGAGVTQ